MTDTEFAQWVDGVLQGCTAPLDEINFATLDAWEIAEGGRSHMNPLNTTWFMPGAIAWNTLPNGAHVWSYATVQDAITATVNTLLTPDPSVGLPNGYDVIVANLRNSLPHGEWQNACWQLRKWGTGCDWIKDGGLLKMIRLQAPSGAQYLLSGSLLVGINDASDANALGLAGVPLAIVDQPFIDGLISEAAKRDIPPGGGSKTFTATGTID